MKARIDLISLCCLAFFLCCLAPQKSKAVTLQVENTTAQPGNEINVRITIDQPSDVAAALFALTYNTSYFSLTSVTSPFFGTFAEQWESLTPIPDPSLPTEVQVDGITYTSPIVHKVFTDKVLLAGTRVKAGQTATALFDLRFTVAGNVPDGIYPVSIVPVSMSEESCGYPAGGESLPLLTTEEGTSLSVSLTAGNILVQSAVVDSDQDGIDDVWEEEMFGDLITAGAYTDYDHDGYTDLQEYLNQLAGQTDPEGNPYDPKEKNAPGGTGYKQTVITPLLWLLLGK
jgi:hypothetical protein